VRYRKERERRFRGTSFKEKSIAAAEAPGMDSHDARSRALRLPAATLILGLSLSGCGGGNSTNSADSGSGATAAPAPSASTSGEYPHHHRHHRRHRGAAADSADSTDTVSAASAASGNPAPAGGTWACGNTQFVDDQQQFASGALQGDQEVDVCGTVTSVLASKTTRSGLHGYYKIQVAPGDTIEIVSDLGEMNAPAWPWVKVGDYSYVQGRYYYDSDSSQGIDWTHHGTSNSWPSAGYVVVNGTEYQ
jgi:hypothetical protein